MQDETLSIGNRAHNNRMQSHLLKRCALSSAADAQRYEFLQFITYILH
jgi:hypothetical protein